MKMQQEEKKFIVDDVILKLAEEFLEENLKQNPSRIRHLYASAECAYELAIQTGANPQEAYFAALLHDVGKGADPEFSRTCFEKYGMKDKFLWDNPVLGHGDISAIMTFEHFKEYGLTYDSDIINAMRFHTFGRENMSLLEKIVYVADLIEPNREYPNVEHLRKLVKEDFENGLYELCADNLRFLISKKIIIHTNALKMLNSLIRLESHDV